MTESKKLPDAAFRRLRRLWPLLSLQSRVRLADLAAQFRLQELRGQSDVDRIKEDLLTGRATVADKDKLTSILRLTPRDPDMADLVYAVDRHSSERDGGAK